MLVGTKKSLWIKHPLTAFPGYSIREKKNEIRLLPSGKTLISINKDWKIYRGVVIYPEWHPKPDGQEKRLYHSINFYKY